MRKPAIATFLVAILISLAVCVACTSEPSASDAKQLLPAEVRSGFEAWASDNFIAMAQAHGDCLARATNDVSAKNCEDEEQGQIELHLSPAYVDLYMETTYQGELQKLKKQHPKSQDKQADLATQEADMQKVLADYDRGRCAMNGREYRPLTGSACAALPK